MERNKTKALVHVFLPVYRWHRILLISKQDILAVVVDRTYKIIQWTPFYIVCHILSDIVFLLNRFRFFSLYFVFLLYRFHRSFSSDFVSFRWISFSYFTDFVGFCFRFVSYLFVFQFTSTLFCLVKHKYHFQRFLNTDVN